MQVNFTGAEYDMLRELADYYKATPAVVVHDWTIERATPEWLALRSRQQDGSGRGDGSGYSDTPIHPSTPIQEP